MTIEDSKEKSKLTALESKDVSLPDIHPELEKNIGNFGKNLQKVITGYEVSEVEMDLEEFMEICKDFKSLMPLHKNSQTAILFDALAEKPGEWIVLQKLKLNSNVTTHLKDQLNKFNQTSAHRPTELIIETEQHNQARCRETLIKLSYRKIKQPKTEKNSDLLEEKIKKTQAENAKLEKKNQSLKTELELKSVLAYLQICKLEKFEEKLREFFTNAPQNKTDKD